MEARILKKESEIISSKELLYDIYVRKMGWHPWLTTNKSNIQVAEGINGKMLIDDFDDCSLICGIFEGNELQARVRFIQGDIKSIELSRYKCLDFPFEHNGYFFEFNRFASRDVRYVSNIICFLLKKFFELNKNIDSTLITATTIQSFQRLYYSLSLHKSIQFKYEVTDDIPATIFFANDINKLLAHFKKRCKKSRGQPRMALT